MNPYQYEVYIQIKTHPRYSSKNLVTCFDDKFICMFYIKCIICGALLLKLENYPKDKLRILVLGSGIGSINYYINKFFKDNVIINSVEIEEKYFQIGKDYFGMETKNSNIKWNFKDAYKYLEDTNKSNYYDLCIIDINNTNHIDGISPPPKFFEEKIISKISHLLKDNGLYCINLMARSFVNYAKSFNLIEKYFPLILTVNNNEDLNKIHLCFKKELTSNEYADIFNNNLAKICEKEEDILLIKNDYSSIMGRISDSKNFKNILNAYSKK